MSPLTEVTFVPTGEIEEVPAIVWQVKMAPGEEERTVALTAGDGGINVVVFEQEGTYVTQRLKAAEKNKGGGLALTYTGPMTLHDNDGSFMKDGSTIPSITQEQDILDKDNKKVGTRTFISSGEVVDGEFGLIGDRLIWHCYEAPDDWAEYFSRAAWASGI